MKRETRTFYELTVRNTVVRIARSLDEALELGALAKRAALSPLHFHRIFRGMLGETPLEMHRRLRMERAAHRLATEDVGVTTIAFDAGYETHEAFTRAFRQAYAASPSEFRQLARSASKAGRRPLQIRLATRSGVHFDDDRDTDLTIHISREGETMNVDIETLPDMRLGAIHHLGPYSRISEAFARLGATPGVHEVFASAGAMMIAVYHDDPESKPQDELRSEAAVVVPPGAEVPAGLAEIGIAGGRYAKTTHVGPYTTLGDVWSRFMGVWLPESGERLGAGSSFEIYRNNPTDTPAEALRTDLYLPLA